MSGQATTAGLATAFRAMRRPTLGWLGSLSLLFLIALVIVAVFAPLVAPYDPNAQELLTRLKPPSAAHLLGTDQYGRDQLSRLIFGARVSLFAGIEVVIVAAAVGVPFGILSGYAGGVIDWLLGYVNDAFMSLPGILLAVTIVAVLGPGLFDAMLAVGIVYMPRFFRVARAATMDIKGETFIEASRAIGCTGWQIGWRHLLPNILSPLAIQVAIVFGAAVVAEASLSFLGLGVRPPMASWGSMLAAAYANIFQAPFLVYAPGVMITLTVLSLSLVGDGLREAISSRRVTLSKAEP